jgi:CBS domain-containing protein/heme-degrading monooxygenase HmoA
MKAWLTARRVKQGHEDEFRHKWRGGATPKGMLDAVLLEDEQDPRETLSVSFWDTAQNLLAYRTSDEAHKREDELSNVVDKTRWSRSFVAWNPWDLTPAGGKKKWVLLPVLLVSAGAAVFYLLKQRGGKTGDLDWDTWEPEPAATYQPETAPAAATAAPPTPQTPPSVRPLASSTRDGGTHPGDQRPSPGRAQAGGRVRDVMTTDPETVEAGSDVATAARLMRQLNVGVLPVMAQGQLAGIITDRDLALGLSDRSGKPSEVRVGDLMTDAPRTIAPDASIEEAARLMAELQVRRLPVVDGHRLVGILSLGDLAADGAEVPAASALEQISEPGTPQR